MEEGKKFGKIEHDLSEEDEKNGKREKRGGNDIDSGKDFVLNLRGNDGIKE